MKLISDIFYKEVSFFGYGSEESTKRRLPRIYLFCGYEVVTDRYVFNIAWRPREHVYCGEIAYDASLAIYWRGLPFGLTYYNAKR